MNPWVFLAGVLMGGVLVSLSFLFSTYLMRKDKR